MSIKILLLILFIVLIVVFALLSGFQVEGGDVFTSIGSTHKDLSHKRILETAKYHAYEKAQNLKNLFMDKKLNLVTVESLTAGLIASTIADIPGSGASLYGGFVVYDTDAKRQFVKVMTKGVYSEETAKQMSEGALNNSRAMVAVAVTGNSMPYQDHRNMLGEVYVGVSIRSPSGPITQTFTMKGCEYDNIKDTCDDWKSAKASNAFKPSYAIVSTVSEYLRYLTVEFALDKVIEVVNSYNGPYGKLIARPYDMECQPSWIIKERLDSVVSTKDCSPTDEKNVRVL